MSTLINCVLSACTWPNIVYMPALSNCWCIHTLKCITLKAGILCTLKLWAHRGAHHLFIMSCKKTPNNYHLISSRWETIITSLQCKSERVITISVLLWKHFLAFHQQVNRSPVLSTCPSISCQPDPRPFKKNNLKILRRRCCRLVDIKEAERARFHSRNLLT